MHLNAAIVFLAVTAHGAAVAKPCDIAQSVLSKFKGAPAVTSVCNSLFGAPPSPTATVTKTTTKTVSPDKVTKLVTTTKTVTVTQKFTDLVLVSIMSYSARGGPTYSCSLLTRLDRFRKLALCLGALPHTPIRFSSSELSSRSVVVREFKQRVLIISFFRM